MQLRQLFGGSWWRRAETSPYFGPSMTNWAHTRAQVKPEGLAAFRRAVAILSDAAASNKPRVMRELDSGGSERVVGTAVARTLRTLSYLDAELATSDCLQTGNGFLRIHRDQRGAPARLEAVPAALVTLATSASGELWYQCAAHGRTEARAHRASDVIHFRYRALDSTLWGVPPLVAAGASFGTATAVYELSRLLAENSVIPGMILSTDAALNMEQVARMKQAADEAAGRFRSGGTMVMSNGMRPVDFRPGVTATEADVIAGLNFSIQEIARAFGIPVALLAQEKDQSFATAAEASRQFAMVTVAPWLNRLSDELSVKLLSADERATGTRVEFDLADALLGHGRERAETLSTMVNAGILSPNEARNLSGLPDIEHGEILRAPTNTFPLARWATEPAPATNGDSSDAGF